MTQSSSVQPPDNMILGTLERQFDALSADIRSLLPMIAADANASTLAHCAQMVKKLEEFDRVLNIVVHPPSDEEVDAIFAPIFDQPGDLT